MSHRNLPILAACLALCLVALPVSAAKPGSSGVLKYSQSSFNVHEDVGAATISVHRIQGTEGAVTVAYETQDGTAVAGEDYSEASGVLEWADGEGGTKQFMVPIVDDEEPEGLETVHLVLSEATGGAVIHQQVGTSTLRIVPSDRGPGDEEEDGPGVLKFESRKMSVGEADGGLLVSVQRKGGSLGAVSVTYATADGTALAGEDYEETTDVLTWDDGDDADKTFMVPILDDDVEEGKEVFHLFLSDPTGGAKLVAGKSEARATIVDDESGDCVPSETALCLAEGRFRVDATWTTPEGETGAAGVKSLSDDSGILWFFDEANAEAIVKILNGCEISGSYWVFLSTTTTLELVVNVTDTATGETKQYVSDQGKIMAPVVDTKTFDGCS